MEFIEVFVANVLKPYPHKRDPHLLAIQEGTRPTA